MRSPGAWGGYAAILLDIIVPLKTGDSVCMQLRRLGCRIPMLAVTGSVDPTDMERMRASGFNGILSKPFTSAELCTAILAAIHAVQAV